MSSKKQAVLAICGLGRAGTIHLKNCVANPLVYIKYLVDPFTEKPERLKEEFFLEKTTVLHSDQFNVVTEDPEVDGVIISSLTHTHEELVKSCIKGKKAIFCEKPIAANLQSVERCYNEAEENNIPLLCAFNRRFDDDYRTLKASVDKGEVGKIHIIKSCSRDHELPGPGYFKSSGGIFHDSTVHNIDLIIWILGEYPNSIFTHGSAFRQEIAEVNDVDTVSITMKFPSGALAQIDMSRYASYGYDQRLEVFGELGMLEAVNPYKTSVVKSNENGICSDILNFSFPQRFDRAYANELQHFVDIITKGIKPLVSKQDVMSVSLIATACEESNSSGKPVRIDYSEKKMLL